MWDALSVWDNIRRRYLVRLFSSFLIETGSSCIMLLDDLTALVRPRRLTKWYCSSGCKMPLAAVFIRDEQHRGISFPKVVPGGSYVSSIKTAHDKNNAIGSTKTIRTTITMTLLIVITGGHGRGPEHRNTAKKINKHRITQSHKKPQHRKKIHFTEHRSVKKTNIAHRKIWDHRNTVNWDNIHRIKKNINTATPQILMSPSDNNQSALKRI